MFNVASCKAYALAGDLQILFAVSVDKDIKLILTTFGPCE